MTCTLFFLSGKKFFTIINSNKIITNKSFEEYINIYKKIVYNIIRDERREVNNNINNNNNNNSPGNYNNNNSSPFNNNNNNRKKLKIILNKMIGFMYLYVYHMVENYNIKIFITDL